MKNSRRLQENITPQEELLVEPILNEAKEPGFVEIINNRIYFYADIDREKTLVLTKNLKNLEDELITRKQVWDLSEIPTLHLHIQSYGGAAHAGFAAYDLIRNLQIPIHTYVDGVAASAATLLIVAGKKRFIHQNSFMLIHQARYDLWGTLTHHQLEDQLENDRNLMKTLKKVYLKETKITEEKLDELLKHDLYFTAEQCLKYGLVDEIIG
jgi:ATP-dependent Clp endopeptidase proteolytic subunit ClpP